MVDFKKLTDKVQMDRGFCAWAPPIKKILGIFTNCTTDTVEERTVGYQILTSDKERWFHIVNGVTGFESFSLDSPYISLQETLSFMSIDGGWVACAGTRGRWDKLFIPYVEIERALKDEGII